jgi:hypothetical protein
VTSETTLRFRTWQFEPASPASLPAQSNYLEPEWTISYENTSLYDVLPVGIEAQATARTLIMEMGWEVSGSFSWSTLLAHQIRFRLLTSLGFGDMPAFAETAIDAQDGFRTLPFKAATADHWISAAASFDISTLKLRGQ